MATKKKFIEEGIKKAKMNEFFREELEREGYGGIDVNRTPTGTQIILYAEKPGMVIGKGGSRIRELTDKLKASFDIEDPSIEVNEVEDPNLNAQVVAQRLSNALERGWYFRRAGYSTLRDIMDSGALGAQIILSGKLTGSRSRVEKFTEGYIKHCGQPAKDVVDEGKAIAKKKLGTIGVTVRIIKGDAVFPDEVNVKDVDELEDEGFEIDDTEEIDIEIDDADFDSESGVDTDLDEESAQESEEIKEGGEESEEGQTEVEVVVCQECGEEYKAITASHLKTHNMDMEEYKEKYPDSHTRINRGG